MSTLRSLFFLSLAAVSNVSGQGCTPPPTSVGTTYSNAETEVFDVGNEIIYTCNFGHYPRGPTKRTCQEDGSWTETDNICQIDVPSLALACLAAVSAIVIFFCLSCFLITRKKRAEHRAERHLTIQRENERNVNGGLDGPALQEPSYNTRKSQITERSDSGLQTDIDMDDVETNLNDFIPIEDAPIDSPIDNRSAHMDYMEG